MDFQELLAKLTGGQAPALQLQQPTAGPAPVDPAGGAAAPAPMGGGPAMPIAPVQQPAPVAAPGQGTTPPDLSAMYGKMLKDSENNKYMDRGMTLLAAGFARPENRAQLISGAMGSGSGDGSGSAGSAITTLLTLQKDQQAKAVRAQQMQRLPAIAKQYGLDMTTVTYLFETGKLDETLNTLAKPDHQVVESSADGSKKIVNMRSGADVAQVSPADPNKGRSSDLKNLDEVNAERVAAGQPPLPKQGWLEDDAKNRATKITIGADDKAETEAAVGAIKALRESESAADKKVGVLETANEARKQLRKGTIQGNALSAATGEGRKLFASVFGLGDEATANTDVFKAKMKDIVLPRVSALGTGNSISNADVKFIEESTGAAQNLSAEAAERILAILERGERNEIAKHNDRYDDLEKANPKAARYLRRVQAPEPQFIAPKAIEMLKADPTPENIKNFQETFGRGTHKYYLKD